MWEHTYAEPVTLGPGTTCSTALRARVWNGESVPQLAADYVETEYFLTGLAKTYVGAVIGPVTTASPAIPYVTRILVRLPNRPEDFSGRVLVEPFNTSFREDREALWAHVGGLVQSQGDAWIGVTVRAKVAAELKTFDPVRYAEIALPTNDLEWDVLRGLGALLKSENERSPLSRRAVHSLYLGGYSQSGADVATFAMAFHHTTRQSDGSPIYDGYFPAAHAASYTAIEAGVDWVPPMEYSTMCGIDVPVIEVQPQSDVEGFSAQFGGATFINPGSASVRRADSDFKRGRYRLYELAGASHAAQLDGCEGSGSRFPTSVFLRAALKLLYEWAEDSVAPPRARRILVQGEGPVVAARVDHYGNPIGGVRLPHLDVPLARYEAHSTPGPLCELIGRETPLPIDSLIREYRDPATYLSRFISALDEAIEARYILCDERELLIAHMTNQVRKVFAPNDYQEVSVR